ncbi:MAG: type II toxin-antitoxin system RelE/ParE family toxin [Magnetococcus sp. XQGC-1]
MNAYTVIFTPRAERQLDNLYKFISDNSGEARADRYVGGVVSDCLSLSLFPERGTKRDDIRPNLRTKGYAKRVTIAFSVHTTTRVVVIHGLFYGGQDFESLLHDTDNDN